ncbi:hypothetical protein GCM10010402_08170 [Actinomadura luteofluorescens]|uniref:hypothetical protein n=1 Tax=Actinomadura luteofluorescens TaxID=46163 RepID=UPI0021644869|nr:hypothetical protein [Actinomadura glauciflava]MCR3738372.1 hypothetical protein [Actinomadura glauciflava]
MTTSSGPFPPDDELNDELTDSELDAALAAADVQLLDHVRAHADPAAALAALLDDTSTSALDLPASLPGGVDASPSGTTPAAANYIRARALAHALVSGLTDTSSQVDDLVALISRAQTIGRASDLNDLRTRSARVVRSHVHAILRVQDLANELDLARDRRSDRANTLAATLNQSRALVRVLMRGFDRAIDRVIDLDSMVGRDLDTATGPAFNLVREIDTAHGLARDLSCDLMAQQVDASGIDLTKISLPDLAVLEGVVWDEFTRWQPGLRDRIADQSEEIAAGIYRVRSGTDRDPHTVPGR